MKTTFPRVVVTGVATATIAGTVALVASGALAFTSRDCKLYRLCDYQGYQNSYNGNGYDVQTPYRAPQTRQSASGQIHPETGITGPHGVGW